MTANETAGDKSLRLFWIFSRILSVAAGVVLVLAIENPILSFFSVLLVGGLLELLFMRKEHVEA